MHQTLFVGDVQHLLQNKRFLGRVLVDGVVEVIELVLRLQNDSVFRDQLLLKDLLVEPERVYQIDLDVEPDARGRKFKIVDLKDGARD